MFSHSHVNIPMYSLSQSPRLRLDVADRFPPAVLSAFAQLVGGSTRGELAKMLGFYGFSSWKNAGFRRFHHEKNIWNPHFFRDYTWLIKHEEPEFKHEILVKMGYNGAV